MMITDSTQALCFIALRGSVIVGNANVDREEIAMVDRAVSGDEAACRWLLARYRDRVLRVAAAALGGASADAEDAAQETFIKAFRSLHSLEKKDAFYGWVCRIAVRICLDQRRLKRATEVSLQTIEQRACSSPCDDTVGTSMLVHQLLSQLTPPMRAALVMRELDGLDYDEIASALSIPVGTVRSRLNSARIKFKDLWTEATSRTEESKNGIA